MILDELDSADGAAICDVHVSVILTHFNQRDSVTQICLN